MIVNGRTIPEATVNKIHDLNGHVSVNYVAHQVGLSASIVRGVRQQLREQNQPISDYTDAQAKSKKRKSKDTPMSNKLKILFTLAIESKNVIVKHIADKAKLDREIALKEVHSLLENDLVVRLPNNTYHISAKGVELVKGKGQPVIEKAHFKALKHQSTNKAPDKKAEPAPPAKQAEEVKEELTNDHEAVEHELKSLDELINRPKPELTALETKLLILNKLAAKLPYSKVEKHLNEISTFLKEACA